MKALVIYTETGGIIPGINALLILSAIVCDIQGAKLVPIEYFHTTVRGDGEIDDSALFVNKITKEQIQGFVPKNEAMSNFINFVVSHAIQSGDNEKMHIFGYNVSFDISFVIENFNPAQRDGWFKSVYMPGVDVMSLAAVKMMNSRKIIPNFKLTTVAAVRGVEVDNDKAHGSMYDVDLTIRVYNSLIGA